MRERSTRNNRDEMASAKRTNLSTRVYRMFTTSIAYASPQEEKVKSEFTTASEEGRSDVGCRKLSAKIGVIFGVGRGEECATATWMALVLAWMDGWMDGVWMGCIGVATSWQWDGSKPP